MDDSIVLATQLNLRTEPRQRPGNRLALLAQGQTLRRLAPAEGEWVRVAVTLQGVALEGYVASRFLGAADAANFPSAALEVHMPENPSARRSRAEAWPFPLSESGQPQRRAQDAAGKVQAIQQIIDWLAVESSARYLKQGGLTYCNVYAYDYCYLGGAYLPRVWWRPEALQQVLLGQSQPVLYGKTVQEMRANALFDWLQSFGPRLGWQRQFDLSAAQSAANLGNLVLLIAKRKDVDRPGHVAAVVPETATATARRDANGQVLAPLQSQAGRNNFRRQTTTSWWTGSQFREWAIWRYP